MRLQNLYVLLPLALMFLFIPSISSSQVSLIQNSLKEQKNDVHIREKRQLEDLESDDYATPVAQEAEQESGFWDRVVKVALRLFNKFIEWLNSS